jgi:hypothetical protein
MPNHEVSALASALPRSYFSPVIAGGCSGQARGMQMAKGQMRSNKEAKKPKKEVPKVSATATSGAPTGAVKKK